MKNNAGILCESCIAFEHFQRIKIITCRPDGRETGLFHLSVPLPLLCLVSAFSTADLMLLFISWLGIDGHNSIASSIFSVPISVYRLQANPKGCRTIPSATSGSGTLLKYKVRSHLIWFWTLNWHNSIINGDELKPKGDAKKLVRIPRIAMLADVKYNT